MPTDEALNSLSLFDQACYVIGVGAITLSAFVGLIFAVIWLFEQRERKWFEKYKTLLGRFFIVVFVLGILRGLYLYCTLPWK